VFDESAADLSGIADADLVVTAVCHAAYLDVDEKGTEAAAATAVVARMLSAFGGGPPVKVTVDRPFLFAIIDTQTSLPLFLGRVVRPR
jgi:serpin B